MLYAVVILGAVVAGFVQGLSGFAFGMVAMSIWIWFLDATLAAQLSIFGALTGQVISAFMVPRTMQWSSLWPFLFGGIVGVPIGVWLLPQIDPQLFKIALGVILILVCTPMLFLRNPPSLTLGGRFADAFFGAIGGVMGAMAGIAGSVPALWVTMRGFDKARQRVVIQNFNLSVLMVSFGIYLSQGYITKDAFPLFPLVVIAVFIPVFLGVRTYAMISEKVFRRIVLWLLIASGVVLLISTSLQWLIQLN